MPPPRLSVARSPIHGYGLFALEDIPPNTNLGVVITRHLTHLDLINFEADVVTSPKGAWIRTIPLGRFINHSREPNCETLWRETTLRAVTRVPILVGTELTMDYRKPNKVIGWEYDFNP